MIFKSPLTGSFNPVHHPGQLALGQTSKHLYDQWRCGRARPKFARIHAVLLQELPNVPEFREIPLVVVSTGDLFHQRKRL